MAAGSEVSNQPLIAAIVSNIWNAYHTTSVPDTLATQSDAEADTDVTPACTGIPIHVWAGLVGSGQGSDHRQS